MYPLGHEFHRIKIRAYVQAKITDNQCGQDSSQQVCYLLQEFFFENTSSISTVKFSLAIPAHTNDNGWVLYEQHIELE